MRDNVDLILKALIVVFQTALFIFGATITKEIEENREDIHANEAKIEVLQNFASREDIWTIRQQMNHETTINARLNTLIIDHEKIKAKLGIE